MPKRIKPRKARKAKVTRRKAKGGKVFALRSIVEGRRIPGFGARDPLSVPFRMRESVTEKHAARVGFTLGEARQQLEGGGKLSRAWGPGSRPSRRRAGPGWKLPK